MKAEVLQAAQSYVEAENVRIQDLGSSDGDLALRVKCEVPTGIRVVGPCRKVEQETSLPQRLYSQAFDFAGEDLHLEIRQHVVLPAKRRVGLAAWLIPDPETGPVVVADDVGDLRSIEASRLRARLPVVAQRQPRTLLEWNVALSMISLMTDAEHEAGKKLPLRRQARLMVEAMPRATRVAEFIAMWTIAKYQGKSDSIDEFAEHWGEPMRTMYRRLTEFREVWGRAGYETPDALADGLIADYRGRRERLSQASLVRLLGAELPRPAGLDVPVSI